MRVLVALIVILALSYAGVFVIRHLATRFEILDIPNERSSHSHSVPRGGGLMIVILSLAGLWLYSLMFSSIALRSLFAYTAGAVLIVAISWLDDLSSQPSWLRFAIHGVAAIAAIYGFGPIPIGSSLHLSGLASLAIDLPITFLWIVGLTNAYNFMDGIDGIAGGQAVVAGIGWAVFGMLTGNSFLIAAGLLISSSSAGFLIHNWSPATIFMGDVGSAFLGYTFAALPLANGFNDQASIRGLTPLAVGLLLIWPFLFDTSFTFLRRLFFGENVFQAHRSHLYQRLVLCGYSHQNISLLYIGLASVGVVSAVGLAIGWRNIPVVIALFLPSLFLMLWGLVARSEIKRAGGASPDSKVADPT
jgi:UDP-N-acetylmuramyl pentapeptide phosphotransferase/UDP-N-acetylglucosamine-1-phosphate transferase